MPGGVGDYSCLVATNLACAGEEVHVWTPVQGTENSANGSVAIHSLPDHFGPHSLGLLNRNLKHGNGSRLLVQYVPHAFGFKAMNVAFCVWLLSLRRFIPIDIMFHEVAFPINRKQQLRHNFLGAVTRLMALMVGRAATRIFVATSAWIPMLHELSVGGTPIEWLPVPSNIPVTHDDIAVRMVRQRCASTHPYLIGHFGTYGESIRPSLEMFVSTFLANRTDVVMVLLGYGSENMRERLVGINGKVAGRLLAPGTPTSADLSRYFDACDLMVQPYPDGVTTRRGSVMAVLAHGRAVATTCGHLTEPIWRESEAVAMASAQEPLQMTRLVSDMLYDEPLRLRLRDAAQKLYRQQFALEHTLARLCSYSAVEQR